MTATTVEIVASVAIAHRDATVLKVIAGPAATDRPGAKVAPLELTGLPASAPVATVPVATVLAAALVPIVVRDPSAAAAPTSPPHQSCPSVRSRSA